MQNIQDLQEKIFFESKSIIDILNKINNVDELLSKQNLIDELADRISFLNLLKTKVAYYQTEDAQFLQTLSSDSLAETKTVSQDFSHIVTEEEAIFNNELNEIGENESNLPNKVMEEEAIFNNELNEIEENSDLNEEISDEEASFSNQLDEIEEEEETTEEVSKVLSFVDEERILENSVPEDEDDIDEEIFDQKVTEEEAIFNNQLNEIEEFEDEISDENNSNSLAEEEQTQNNSSVEKIPTMFESDQLEEEILIEESENEQVSDEIEYDEDEVLVAEDSDRRKIIDIDKPTSESENPASDESFENLEAYQQEKKIRLANIKGLKSIQTLFDDDPLEREISQEKPASILNEDAGSLLKTNIPTDFMEADKQKPEFRLDLNDRMAFTKLLFGGSQTDLNHAVSELNRCRNLQEAKEYLSELYYDRKWDKVDEYAQRLWVLVENKFL